MNKKATQPVNGILLLNKPSGITSNKALQIVKRVYNAKKAGHTGSLDPLATGMLPICFGEATKFSQYLLNADKTYNVTGKLGITTDTADSMGQVISSVDDFEVKQHTLQRVLSKFTGSIEQVPSMFSALKHKGQPLYKLARSGVEVRRKPRSIEIYSLQLNSFNGTEFNLTVKCSKGTYIRNLVEDVGNELTCGAHVTQLHRLSTAGFESQPMHALDKLNAQKPDELINYLHPLDCTVAHLPAMCLSEDNVLSLRQGKCIYYPEEKMLDSQSQKVRLYSPDNTFIGVGEFHDVHTLKAHRLIAY